ncbi:TPA: hypothetical protein DD394_07575 [bacterium UBP9_UBA11836]|nr:hypothetical protein [bacterium UBP9_UBA11836]
MRVTEKLLLGIACSALCLTMAGCSDDDNWSPTDNLSKKYELGTVTAADSATLLVSNGQSEKGFTDDIYITSSALPGKTSSTESTEAKLEAEEGADPHGLTHKLIEEASELLQAKATDVKVLGKESFTPNTVYTTTAKDEDIVINADFNFSGTTTKATFRKILANDETKSVLVFAEVDPDTEEACIDEEKALAIDKIFGEANSYDDEGKAIGERVRSVFGKEWSKDGGRDGEEKIVIMMCSSMKKTLYGYFDPKDAFSKEDSQDSNEGEILYLNSNCSDTDLYSTIAHEFQHMCDFNQKVCLDGEFSGQYEDTTINEGKSTLAEDLCGFRMRAEDEDTDEKTVAPSNSYLFKTTSAYLANPGKVSLLSFNNALGEYGQAYLLMKYITDRYGTSTITEIATSPNVSFDNIEDVTGTEFSQLYYDFGMTNLLSNKDNAPILYNYKSIDLNKNYLHDNDEASPIGRATPVEVTSKSNKYKIKSMSNNYYSITYSAPEENVGVGLVTPTTSKYSLSFFRNGLLNKIF